MVTDMRARLACDAASAGAYSPPRAIARVGREKTGSIRDDAAAADIDAVGFPRAVELALCPQDRDLRADLQLAALADGISENARARRNDDALLAVLVLDRHHLPVDAGARVGDGGVGHGALRRAVPRPEAFAQAALALGEPRDADCALAAVGICLLYTYPRPRD